MAECPRSSTRGSKAGEGSPPAGSATSVRPIPMDARTVRGPSGANKLPPCSPLALKQGEFGRSNGGNHHPWSLRTVRFASSTRPWAEDSIRGRSLAGMVDGAGSDPILIHPRRSSSRCLANA